MTTALKTPYDSASARSDELQTWNMGETRAFVRKRFGPEQLGLINPVLQAVASRLRHAEIHFEALTDNLGKHVDKRIKSERTLIQSILKNISEDDGTTELHVMCDANFYACIQAMHSIADNIAHASFYALGWNRENKGFKGLSLKTLLSKLDSLTRDGGNFQPIITPLSELLKNPHFKQLHAATNYIKHHGGIRTSLLWHLKGEAPYQFQMTEFIYADKSFPQQDILPFLEQAHTAITKGVVNTGRAINDWLQGPP